MAITSSAKKALRASKRKAVFNARRKDAVKGISKKIKKLVSEKKFKEAQELLPHAYKAFDKAAKTNYLKKNTASRMKSRMSAFIKRAATEKA